MTYWLAWEEPRAVGDLVHVEKFFARNLGGLIHARTRVPGRLGKATSRTSSMYVDEKSDEHDKPAVITEPYEKAFTAANVKKEQDFHESDLTFSVRAQVKGKETIIEFTLKPNDNASKILKEALADADHTLSVDWTHRHYVQDDEYIPHGEDIEAFLNR